MAGIELNALQRLQEWYVFHCDGAWEHNSVVRIETMDNPGWYLEVDIYETELADKAFEAEKASSDDGRWHECYIKGGKFIVYGGQFQLEELINIFLNWAGKHSVSDTTNK